MNTQLVHAPPKIRVSRSPVFSALVRQLRSLLRMLGVFIFHLGLAPCVISLSPARVRTLLYHAVEDQPRSHTSGLGMNISPEVFRQHLDYFKRHYKMMSMHDIVAGRSASATAVLTFDDGYASVGDHAVPALEERGMPATVYLIGKAVRGGMIWVNQLNHALNSYPQVAMAIVNGFPGLENADRGNAIHLVQTQFGPAKIEQLIARLEASLPLRVNQPKLFMSREDILSLRSRGISFGFHSNDHYNLQLCTESTLHEQLDSSDLDELLDSRTFAYPFGYCGDREADRVEARGYQRAMLVRKDTPHPRKQNMKRSEPTGRNAAEVFAQLEIEEPLMNFLRLLFR